MTQLITMILQVSLRWTFSLCEDLSSWEAAWKAWALLPPRHPSGVSLIKGPFLGLQKPTLLRVPPSN